MYLFKVTVVPETGYRTCEKRKKPFYVVASNKEEAKQRLQSKLIVGWKISSVSVLGEQLSGVLFHS